VRAAARATASDVASVKDKDKRPAPATAGERLDLTIVKGSSRRATAAITPLPAMPPEAVDASVGIGFQLRRERRLKKLRLKDVADATGLSVSFISKIETNKVSPSLSTLHKIAKVLNTSVSALFSIEETLSQVVWRPPERPIAGKVQSMREWDGIEAEIMVPYAQGRLLEGFVFIMQPGGHSGGLLQHEGEECGYVLSGQLELVVGGTRYVLNPGDSFFFPSVIPHAYRNCAKVITRVIWINTPPTF
jgi:transcriptional regulator with XRE-family HTH domain